MTREQRRKYQAAYRKKKGGQVSYHKTWAKKNPKKVRAQNKLNAAVEAGRIKRPAGKQAHHEDYSKPLRVKMMSPIAHAKTKPNTKKKGKT